ncbi:hypothetical protein [Streptomyces cellulosae]|uniref:Uncharacterized protein n=1 Tax=Streptomyces cellulosae TaxID=1968 RepID=A0ABW7YGM7_STRCE
MLLFVLGEYAEDEAPASSGSELSGEMSSSASTSQQVQARTVAR